jgi:hypothetical protein
MINLLSLFAGNRKKNDTTAPAVAKPAASVDVVPERPPTSLEERQQLLAHHVRLVARGMANGLCVYGSRGGLGKTRVVLATLREEGVEPVILTGHCTPLAMYTSLYEHPESVIFLDDCDAMFRILPALGILRSALWEGDNGHRLVTYNSSQLKIPSSFHFTGRVIFAINTLPRQNFAFSAVLSRIDQFELDASNEEVLTMLRQLAAQGFEDKLTSPSRVARWPCCFADFARASNSQRLLLRNVSPPARRLASRTRSIGKKCWSLLASYLMHDLPKKT